MWQLRWMLYMCALTASVAYDFDNFDELLVNSKVFMEFQKRLVDLEERDLVQQSQILKLTNDLAERTQENIALQETVNELQSLLDVKNIAVPDNSTQTTTPLRVKTEQTTRHRVSNYVQRNFNRALSRRQQLNQADVAFSTGLTHTIPHIGKDQNIIFDKVNTNIGNGYNVHQGAFIAPVAGTYVFYSSILADNNREVWCRFVVNGVHGDSIYARGTDGRHDQGSNMIVVQLNQGDDVSVQNMVSDDAIYGDVDMYSTFSGFLVRGAEGELVVG